MTQVEHLDIGDHNSFQELENLSDFRTQRLTQQLRCKEEDASVDTTSRDSEDVSQYFKNEENSTPTKRRKTRLVRREISYDCDHEIKKGNSVEYPVSDHHSYDDSLNSGSPKLLLRPFGFSLINSYLCCFFRGPRLSGLSVLDGGRGQQSASGPQQVRLIESLLPADSAYTPSYSPVRPPHPTSSTDQSNSQPSKRRMKPPDC